MNEENNHFAGVGKKVGIVAALGLLGAFISRLHGGGFFTVPKFWKTLAWTIPFGVISFFAHYDDKLLIALAFTLISSGLVFAGKATGHGGGMDLGHNPKEPGAVRDPEKLEYLILWLHGKIPMYWYDVLMMTIIGLFSVAGAAFAVGYVIPWAGVVIALGGLGKPIGYMIGWMVYPNGEGKGIHDLDHATALGEALTGLFAYVALGIAGLMVFHDLQIFAKIFG